MGDLCAIFASAYGAVTELPAESMMKKDVLTYPKFEHIPGDFGKRITPFVILSCALHLGLVISIFSLTSQENIEKERASKPILVDFMEHKEGVSPEPASLSPNPIAPKMTARDSLPRTPPPPPPINLPPKWRKGSPPRLDKGRQKEKVSPRPNVKNPSKRLWKWRRLWRHLHGRFLRPEI